MSNEKQYASVRYLFRHGENILDYKKILDGINRSLECIKEEERKPIIQEIILAALNAVDPYECVSSSIKKDESAINIKNKAYNLYEYKNIYLISIGKAALPMAKAIQDKIGEHITEGVVVTKTITQEFNVDLGKSIKILLGGHPIPNQSSINCSKVITKLLKRSKKDDLVIFLISGGASALITAPRNNISLGDLQGLTKTLFACGADIGEINSLRKHLDLVKGGGLVRMAYPAKSVTLVLSDVIGNPLDIIASGPTVADKTTFKDAYDVIKKYDLEKSIPGSILNTLQDGLKGKIPDTIKAGEKCLEITDNIVIASNLTAAKNARMDALKKKFSSQIYTTYLSGEANHIGFFLSCLTK